MNSFGAVVSLLIHLAHKVQAASAPPLQESAAKLAAGAVLEANASGLALQAVAAPTAAPEASWIPQFLLRIGVVISRGVLAGVVLKNLDSIAKGLIDVTAIVVCTGIQFSLDPDSADGTVVGLQSLMLLSILSYIIARAGAPPSNLVPPQKASNDSPSMKGAVVSPQREAETIHLTSAAKGKQ